MSQWPSTSFKTYSCINLTVTSLYFNATFKNDASNTTNLNINLAWQEVYSCWLSQFGRLL